MIVHTSPSEDDLLETICTLTFAKRVRSIESNRELSEVVDYLILKLSISLPENSFVFHDFQYLIRPMLLTTLHKTCMFMYSLLIFSVSFVGNKKDKAEAHCRARPHDQRG